MYHRTLLVVAVLLAASTYFSTAHGQFDVGNAAVRATAKSMATDVIQDAGAGVSTSRAVTWGARMFTRTNVLIAGATLIPIALQYFYEVAQQSTGTTLDTWSGEGGGGWGIPSHDFSSVGTWQDGIYRADNASEIYDVVEGLVGYRRAAALSVGLVNGDPRIQLSLMSSPSTVYDSSTWMHVCGAWPVGLAPTAANATACANASLEAYLDANHLEAKPAAGQGWADIIASDPAAHDALRDRVLPDYVDAGLPDSAVPHTYAEPFGPDAGITLDPVPTPNQYMDDPYFSPDTDTDGDGYKDWEEDQAGTDPSDPNSTPDASPDPNRDTDGDGYPDWYERDQGTDPNDVNDYPSGDAPDPAPDADGDGVADANDPCPFSAANTCAANAEADTLAQESTLQESVGVLEDIRDGTAANEYGFVDPAPATFANPDLSPLQAWQPDLAPVTSSLDTAIQDIGSEFDPVFVAAEGTFPFGMTQLLLPPAGAIGSDCAPATLTIMGATETINVCDSPMDDFMVNTLRPILTALLTFGALWLVMGWIRSA